MLQDETPLFLAAREGSYQACKALLEAYANREITDHMDRLPRDVASERLHHDIVRLLEEHVPRSPQMVNVIPNNSMMSKFSLFYIFISAVNQVKINLEFKQYVIFLNTNKSSLLFEHFVIQKLT